MTTSSVGSIELNPAISAKPRNTGWLPFLTVLFLISYGLMTMLIVEQGATIETQRALIRDLFRDSVELSAMKGKAVRENNAKHSGQAVTPKAQDPAVQPSSPQTHSSQAIPQHRAQTQSNTQKPQVKVPSRPASDLADERRSLITI